MMNEKARIGFLSAILNIEPADIKETQILNTYLRKEGIEIGKEQGEYDKSIQIAKNLISLGSNVDFIVKATNLSIEQIQALRDTQD